MLLAIFYYFRFYYKSRMKIVLPLLSILFVLFSARLSSQELTELKHNIKTAEDKNDTLLLTKAWYQLGKYYDNLQQMDESNQALRTAMSLAKKNNNHKSLSSVANYLASNFSITGESDSAIIYYNLAIDACIKSADSLKLSGVLINLGDEYASTGNYVTAARHSLMAIRIKETLKDSANLAYYYQKVGEIYKLAGENDKWEEYVHKAYRLISNEKHTSIKAIAGIYNDLGGIAETQGNYNQALLYYDTLVSIGKKNNYHNAVGVALSNSATIYKLQGNIQKALETAIEALKFKNQTPYQQIYDSNLLAELYLENGNQAKSLKYATEAEENKSIGNYPEEKARTFKILYQAEKQNRNYGQALNWLEKYKQLSDSIRDKEIRTQIVDLEVAYQTEKKEQQIELLTTENELKNQRLRNGIILLAVLIVIIVMVLYILQIRRKQARLIQNDLQQQVLRSQMNPHFIFNVLGSIQNFLQENDNKNAAKYLARFASLTRATLEYSSSESISLTNEITMLTSYMELEKMRNPGKFDYMVNTEDLPEPDFINIPPMMIQPFIENAIKHGFSDIHYPGVLTVTITDKNQWINFVIEDNGRGMEPGKTSGHRPMAMEIFEKRRKLFQQKHKKEIKFEKTNLKDTDPAKSGVKISIHIPVFDYD